MQYEKHADWVELHPRLEFMFNIKYQSTTRQSPAEIVFGRQISIEWCNVNKNIISQTIYEENHEHNMSTISMQSSDSYSWIHIFWWKAGSKFLLTTPYLTWNMP